MSQALHSSPNSVPRDLYRLMSAWADDALTDEEFAQLDELLKHNVEARQTFARYVRICQSLPELVVPSFSSGEVEAADLPERTSNPQASPARIPQRFRSGFDRLRQLRQTPWIVMATLLTAVFVGVMAVLWTGSQGKAVIVQSPPAPSANLELGDTPLISKSVMVELDSHLAVVTRSDGVVWEPGTNSPEIGAALESQVLRIKSGTLEVEFACGASVRLRGPAEFSLVSKTRGKLSFGELSTQVPDEAHGFVIDTPSVEVVDLGTEFGINVNRLGISEVHVFRGLVETRMPSGGDQPGLLERLTVDQTRRFTLDQSKSEVLSFDQSKFPAPPERYHDEPTTQGAICLLREPPKSLAVGALESNEFILLLAERENVQLYRPIPVSLTLPGRYDRFRNKDGKLRPPQRVDSYLLHFDALSTPQNYSHLRLDGSVTFPRPILGVLAVGQILTLTDPLFGISEVIQSDARSRGLDRKAKGSNLDVVTLSEDRRTLHVNFSVKGSCDQLRILIEAEQDPGIRPPDTP